LDLTLPRIYSPERIHDASICKLGADHLRYLKSVLRLKPGDQIIVFDGFGHEFEARIESFNGKGINVVLEAPLPTREKRIRVTLAQGIPKAGKMDIIVKTVAELGADEIIPYQAHRSVKRVDAEKASEKVTRWQKIAQEAARSSRSSIIASVKPVLSFDKMLLSADPNARKLIFWEEEQMWHIRDVLQDPEYADFKNFFIIVGPEGGLSREEVQQAKICGFISVSLGNQILKVETAAAAILSILQYEKGIFSHTTGEGGK
jgi:16S rRNA (uracil1498-N3)-methyltransferase